MTTEPVAARRDLIAGLLLVVLGAATIVQATTTIQVGTLQHVGPGFFPTLLGGILILLGVMLVMLRKGVGPADEHDAPVHERPDWRGWACIIGGVVLFIVLGEHGGLAPATFACVFVSALGDRSSSPLTALVLATGCTLFAAVVFSGLLHFQLPLFGW